MFELSSRRYITLALILLSLFLGRSTPASAEALNGCSCEDVRCLEEKARDAQLDAILCGADTLATALADPGVVNAIGSSFKAGKAANFALRSIMYFEKGAQGMKYAVCGLNIIDDDPFSRGLDRIKALATVFNSMPSELTTENAAAFVTSLYEAVKAVYDSKVEFSNAMSLMRAPEACSNEALRMADTPHFVDVGLKFAEIIANFLAVTAGKVGTLTGCLMSIGKGSMVIGAETGCTIKLMQGASATNDAINRSCAQMANENGTPRQKGYSAGVSVPTWTSRKTHCSGRCDALTPWRTDGSYTFLRQQPEWTECVHGCFQCSGNDWHTSDTFPDISDKIHEQVAYLIRPEYRFGQPPGIAQEAAKRCRRDVISDLGLSGNFDMATPARNPSTCTSCCWQVLRLTPRDPSITFQFDGWKHCSMKCGGGNHQPLSEVEELVQQYWNDNLAPATTSSPTATGPGGPSGTASAAGPASSCSCRATVVGGQAGIGVGFQAPARTEFKTFEVTPMWALEADQTCDINSDAAKAKIRSLPIAGIPGSPADWVIVSGSCGSQTSQTVQGAVKVCRCVEGANLFGVIVSSDTTCTEDLVVRSLPPGTAVGGPLNCDEQMPE